MRMKSMGVGWLVQEHPSRIKAPVVMLAWIGKSEPSQEEKGILEEGMTKIAN